ncbi:MAG: hypothetical protein ACRDYU_03735 [Actinomycetes bacterium]
MTCTAVTAIGDGPVLVERRCALEAPHDDTRHLAPETDTLEEVWW